MRCVYCFRIFILTIADCLRTQALNAVMKWQFLFFFFKVRRMLTAAKTQIDRKTERQRDRERQRETERDRETQRETERHRERQRKTERGIEQQKEKKRDY